MCMIYLHKIMRKNVPNEMPAPCNWQRVPGATMRFGYKLDSRRALEAIAWQIDICRTIFAGNLRRFGCSAYTHTVVSVIKTHTPDSASMAQYSGAPRSLISAFLRVASLLQLPVANGRMDFFRQLSGSDRIGFRKKAPTRPRSTSRQKHDFGHIFENMMCPSRIGNAYHVLLARASRLRGDRSGSGR